MAKNDDTEPAELAASDRDRALVMFEVLDRLHAVARAELAKGPGIASNAWAELANAIAPLLGHDEIGRASPVIGRQPVVMPPGYKHPIPPKGGAQPLVRPENVTESAGDIRKRSDVAAELERVTRGGK